MILPADIIFFQIYESLPRKAKYCPIAYEQAEQIFMQKTKKGFGQPYRKYKYFEVFNAAYYKYLKRKSNHGNTNI